MITIKNLTVSFNNQKVLDNLSFTLPNTGLIAITGPSGCGKTTLFNCISGLLDYEGEIVFDKIELNKIPLTKRNNFRLKNIGFVFQDFKLFNLDNVIHNVAFPLSVSNGLSSSRNKRRVMDLLSLVGLEDKANQNVKNLSGGEKQRVAIARSLINNPRLILADEPTGALDEENAHMIMELLKKISESKLVIIVSHDKALLEEYADQIITLKDGVVNDISSKNQEKSSNSLLLMDEEKQTKAASIPFLFLLRHTLSSIKERRWRTLLTNLVTSLGLIGVGLAFSLSSSISTNIKEACTNLFSENQIMMSQKEQNNIQTVEGADYLDLVNIKRMYPEYISEIKAVYESNFNNFFIDQDFSLYSNKTKIELSNYTFKEINGYQKLTDELITYPDKVGELKDDEIVMSFSLGTIYNICYQLQIIRTVESFIDYMKHNDVYLHLHLRNENWMYEDEHIFKLRGFSLDYQPIFYHSSNLWNEYLVESLLKIPHSLYPYTIEEKPWTLKKLYYLVINDDVDRDLFLHKVRYERKMDQYLFEIGRSEYFPYSIKEEEVKDIKRIIVFKSTYDNISPRITNTLTSYFPMIKDITLGSYGGYLVHKEAMMMGFSNYTFFSSDKKLLFDTLEKYSSLPTLTNQSLDVNSDIKVGHYSKSLRNGVVYKELKEPLSSGRKPNNLDEIVVSSKLYSSFSRIKNNQLSIAVTTKEEKVSEEKTLREFTMVDVTIVGIVDSEDLLIYHDVDWPIEFFMARIGISSFSLGINTICLSFKNDTDMEEMLSNMKRAFPDYEIVNPLSSINEGIDEVCRYLELAMIIFSSISIVISIFLLSMCNYLHAYEIKNDIGLARCIGVSGLESTRFVFFHSYVMGFISLLTASFQLVVTSYFISYSVAHHLEVPFVFSFNPRGLLYMYLLTLVITTISSLFISLKVLRFSPIESLKVM